MNKTLAVSVGIPRGQRADKRAFVAAKLVDSRYRSRARAGQKSVRPVVSHGSLVSGMSSFAIHCERSLADIVPAALPRRGVRSKGASEGLAAALDVIHCSQ